MGIGIKLYTLSDDTSLKKLPDFGYKNLELNYSGGKFYGFALKEMKMIDFDLDMVILSTHTQVEAA